MFKLNFIALISTICLVFSSYLGEYESTARVAKTGSWEELGKQLVSPGAEYDALEIPESEISYKQLKFKVLKSSIYIKNLTVIYTDGTSESHIITRQFKKKNSSRVFDLAAHGRIIKKILFTYRAKASARSEAELQVYGRI